MFLSDEDLPFKTVDFTFYISSTSTFYISMWIFGKQRFCVKASIYIYIDLSLSKIVQDIVLKLD